MTEKYRALAAPAEAHARDSFGMIGTSSEVLTAAREKTR